MIYLDNAATTMHKPQTVIDAVTQAMCSLGNAGRGATSGALDAARTIHGCRAKLARLLEMGLTQFVIEHFSFTETTHIQLDSISFQLMHQLERTNLLTFQYHPVTYGDLVTLFFLFRCSNSQHWKTFCYD